MDPLHLCIALGPVAIYFLLLGSINLSRRPFVTSGTRDAAALGIAIGGFVVAGPMELFLPESAAVRMGVWVWPTCIAFYILCLSLAVLLMRPKIVIYNVTFEQLRPSLADVVLRLDSESRWAGDSLVMPNLGVQLTVESQGMMKNVLLVAAGKEQSFQGWRLLENEVTTTLHSAKGTRNAYGMSLIMFGLLMAASVIYWLSRDPQGVAQALNEMLRK
ncbi:MAG: hypothetical protein IAF94_05315 [Pirellulaceae bacterium]|nr:hypothetical protein [Pirellulaceae bacterium]